MRQKTRTGKSGNCGRRAVLCPHDLVGPQLGHEVHQLYHFADKLAAQSESKVSLLLEERRTCPSKLFMHWGQIK